MLNLNATASVIRSATPWSLLRKIPLLLLFAAITILGLLLLRMGLSALLANWLSSQFGLNGVSDSLLTALGVALFPPVFALFGKVWKPGADGRRAQALLALLVSGVLSVVSMAGYGMNFRGDAQRYYAITPEGVSYFQQPGKHPVYGTPLKPVTAEVATMLKLLEKRAFFRVNPAKCYWFHPNTGDPLLWYSAQPDRSFRFFSRYGRNPDTGEELLPVTPEIRDSWLATIKKPQGGRQ